ncbi:hypothetical protein ACHAWF_005822 [Thalassiosira exigua]
MGFENARDSFADLQLKQEKQESRRRLVGGGGAEQRLNKNNNQLGEKRQLKRETRFRPRKDARKQEASKHEDRTGGGSPSEDDLLLYVDLGYEPCDVGGEEEENWPVWEMTGHKDENISSLAACERIFTVPEVYDEIMQGQRVRMSSMILRDDPGSLDSEGPCGNILSCFAPWKQPTTTVVTVPDHEEDEYLSPHGVLKRSSIAVQLYIGLPAATRQSFTPSMYRVHLKEDEEGKGGGGSRKRATIVGNDDTEVINKGKYKVHFSELKQVLRVRKFTPEEAPIIWFQREDFDFFRNEMSLLIQEDCLSHELAEVWLDANEWERRRSSNISDSSEDGGGANGMRREDSNGSTGNADNRKSSRSWWHDYDHSRRGLERYATPGQARQIVASYKAAVDNVLGEQQRQRCLGFFCVPGANDPDKIAEIYHEYTAWSRDLALAAGASDADAVMTNFDDDKRHTREYYMLKQVVASGYKVHKYMPEFMLPKCIVPKGFVNEGESLYSEGKVARAPVPHKGMAMTGEEARKEMSELNDEDLHGPVSPALVASLQLNDRGMTKPILQSKTMTMSEKAKNFPFQQ